MRLILHTFELRLKHTFTIAHDSRNVQPTLIVELSEGEIRAFGEATSNKYYGITLEKMREDLMRLQPLIEAYEGESAEELWEIVHPYLTQNPFAHCALDEAAHDFFAKKQRKKLYEHWGLRPDNLPRTNYTIGIDAPEKMVEKLLEMPWPIYKIKLGTADDLGLVRTLRRHTEAVFRVDANCAWTADQTLAHAPELKALGVEFIEQPLPAHDVEGMRRVKADCMLPVIADESCIVPADVAACAELFDGINIKLTKCGGLTPARRMIAEARSRGLLTMVGCMNESSVGISAIAHLLPLLDYVDMDGTLLIENDPASGVTFDFGRVLYADAYGTGASLK